VSTHSYIGIRDTDRPNLVRARYVHSDGHPGAMIPTLRAVWAGVAGGDTTRLITLLLGHDGDYLDPAVTDHTRPVFAGQQPVAGVGMTLAATDGRGSVLPPEPVTVVPLTAAPALDAEWIYLLDTAGDTVVVHTADADPIAVVPLAAQRRAAVEGPPTEVWRR
jgi:hypothetical protein